MSCGFEAAGFDIVGALESIPVFARTHETNFKNCQTVIGEAQSVSPDEFAARVAFKGDLDVLIGGPPCQTFSTIGRAKIRHVLGGEDKTDPRNYLFETFLQYVEYFAPKVFVMENVPQLRTKYNGKLFDRLIDLASAHNYEIHISVLNAVDFGVPQNRKRLFIVGTKRGLSFSFPAPCFASKTQTPEKSSDLPAIRTVRQALEDLPLIYDGCRLGELPYSREPKNSFQSHIRSNTGLVGNNVCRVSNERAKTVFRHMNPGDKYMDLPPEVRKILPFREDIFFDRLKRLKPDEPSWTVLAHIGMDGYMYIHPWEDRTLSVREAARLQSFPDSFSFVGNMREQYVQVGNAVPPLLAKALGLEVLGTLQ